jgi:phasin family protein
MARKKEPAAQAVAATVAAKRNAAAVAGVPLYGYAEIVDLTPGHIEAAVQANAALAKALERVNKELMGLARSSMENATNAAKALFGARTLSDVVAVNSGYAKSTFDTLVAGSTKLSEIGAEAAQATLQPINARVQATLKAFGSPLTAAA